MGFHNFKWFELGMGLIWAIVIAVIVASLVQSAFRSSYLLGVSCVVLCNAIICGILSYYISKEASFFFLGLLLGEIGVAVAIVVRANNKQKSNVSSKNPSEHRQSKDDKYATLERLDGLRKKKIITEKEFQAEKSKILSGNRKERSKK